MSIFYFQILLYSVSIIFFCILFPQTNSLTFNITNFDAQQSQISRYGAYITPQGGLQVTSNERNTNLTSQVGKATYVEPLQLWDNSTGNLTDFSTHFVFVIGSGGNKTFADGLAFFLAPNGSNIRTGGAMGLPVDPVTHLMNESSPFVAVEFDAFSNVAARDGWDKINTTHVGINVNTLESNATAVWYSNIPQEIKNEAWIKYDSISKNLSVVVTGTNTTSINFIVDLRDYLPELVTFGFSAATGQRFETHNVKSWDFSSSLEIKEKSKISLGAVVGLVVGSGVLVGGFVLVGFGLWRRSRPKKEDDEFDVEMSMENEFEFGSGPKKFSYRQLSQATNNFDEEQKLGEGGFGGVYRGFLKELNSYIAVKRVSKGSKQGIKEYATEVKIIGRLRHRNLVQLIGWCHEKKELLLVYEFLENGSLDFHLFKGKSLLTWGTRYKIAQGLASALLYLHEEWEQCVVHRDIKSSNVMLDSNFNAKLGDFGLARFVDHEKEPETTLLAGTMGYLAPECAVIGKARKESDVYSFGVVALEIACGRKPYDLKVPESQIGLVEWVQDLYGMGRLLEAVDTKLVSEFDKEEIERLMIVGLWCVHPDHNFRPKIRQVIHVLEFEAPLPILQPNPPALSFLSPLLSTTNTCFNTV